MMERLILSRAFYVALIAFSAYCHVWTVKLAPQPKPWPASALPKPAEPAADLSAEERFARASVPTKIAWYGRDAALLFLMLAGAWLSIQGLRQGRLRQALAVRPASHAPWSFGELWRIFILVVGPAFWLPALGRLLRLNGVPKFDRSFVLMSTTLVIDVLVIGVIFWFARRKGGVSAAFGLARGTFSRNAKQAFDVYVRSFPWICLGLAVAGMIGRFFGWEPKVPPIQLIALGEYRPIMFVVLFILACGVAPAAEELFFRGVLYPVMRRRLNRLAAMAASGLCFGLVHGNWLAAAPVTVLGMILAYLYDRTGNLLVPFGVHAVHNTILLANVMFMRHLNGA